MAKRHFFLLGAIAGAAGAILGFRSLRGWPAWLWPGAVAPLHVTFTDIELIAAGTEPPFPDHEGTYEDPGICIGASGVPPPQPPQNVACPGTFVIYSSWGEVVGNCAGFAGPGAGNNAIVQRARQEANALAARIPCADGCTKRVAEIWKGWDCTANNPPIRAYAAVELKIFCEVTT
jgi:hypothetical protein